MKTFLPVQIGLPLDLDDVDPTARLGDGLSVPYGSNHSISCYQFYDVALTQTQIRRTMNLCRAEGWSTVLCLIQDEIIHIQIIQAI